MFYLTIADQLGLPVYFTFYPGHAALIWQDDNNTFYWESTSDEVYSLYDYQTNFSEYDVSLSSHNYLAKPLHRNDAFLHAASLLSRTAKTFYERLSYADFLVKQKYVYSTNIPKPSNESGVDRTEFSLFAENYRTDYYNQNSIINAAAVTSSFKYTELYDEKIIHYLGSRSRDLTKDFGGNTEYYRSFLDDIAYAYKRKGNFAKALHVAEDWLEVNKSEHVYKFISEMKAKLDESKKKI